MALLYLISLTNVLLGLIVFIRNPKRILNRHFLGLSIFLTSWIISSFLEDEIRNKNTVLLLARVDYASAILIGLFFLLLCFSFIKALSKRSTFLIMIPASFLFLAIISPYYQLIIKDVVFYQENIHIVLGPLEIAYSLVLCTYFAAGCIFLAKHLRELRGHRRSQIFYMFLGLSISAGIGLVTNVAMPQFSNTGVPASVSRVGIYGLIFFTGFTAYAIIKHRLMDIRLVVLRSVAYSLMVAVFGSSFVLLIQFMRSSYANALNMNSSVVFVIGGLIAAFGFQPLRRLLERATDKVFYKKRYNPQKLLGELSMAMSSTIDLNELAMLITATLKREMKLSRMAVLLDGAAGREELKGEGFEIPRSSFEKIMQICLGRRIVVTDELEEDAEEKAMLREHDISVLLSLVVENELIGVLLFGNKLSGDMYTTQDVEFLEILAPEASIAVKNAELFEEKTMRVRELGALNKLAFTLGTNLNLETILDQALKQIMYVTEADSGSIMLLDEKANALVIKAAKAIKKEVLEETHVEVGEGIAGWVAKNKEPLILVDDLDPRFQNELKRQEIVSAITVPLIAKEKVIGVLSVNRNKSPDLFSKENLNVVNSFAGQLAVAIENARLYRDLESTFLGTISALAAAVDAKDPYTYGHSNDVTKYAVKIAKQLLLPESEIETIRIAATLHDIGKIGIDASILNKPGKLDQKERIMINRHPSIGVNILESLEFLQDVVPLILFHHERFDGKGYPSGITDGSIPLGARIIAVADSFNAMTSDRPYRKALSHDQAIKELEDNIGTQFDPSAVSAFLKVLSKTSSKKKSLKSSKQKKPARQKVQHKK